MAVEAPLDEALIRFRALELPRRHFTRRRDFAAIRGRMPWRFKSSRPHSQAPQTRPEAGGRGSARACFVVALLLARNLSRLRADVPALEAQKRTGGCQPDTRPGPADRTRRELLRAKPLMQVEIRHRCGRRADFHIVCLDAASHNGPNGLSRVEKVLALADQEALNMELRHNTYWFFVPRYGTVSYG